MLLYGVYSPSSSRYWFSPGSEAVGWLPGAASVPLGAASRVSGGLYTAGPIYVCIFATRVMVMCRDVSLGHLDWIFIRGRFRGPSQDCRPAAPAIGSSQRRVQGSLIVMLLLCR